MKIRFGIRRGDSRFDTIAVRGKIHVRKPVIVMREQISKALHQWPIGIASENPQAAQTSTGRVGEPREDSITAEKKVLPESRWQDRRPKPLGLNHRDRQKSQP